MPEENAMRISPRRSLPILAPLLFCAASAFAQPAGNPSGHWEGQIEIPDHVLTMSVDLAMGPTGTWAGSLSILHSSTVDVPLDTVTIDDGVVGFTASLPGKTSFDGHLSANGRELSGTAANESGGVPFRLTRTGEADVKLPPPSSRLVKAFEGTWEGTLDVDGQTRRVRVKLSASVDGTATAVLISVDKGNLEIPVTTVTLHDQEVQLDARAISGRFRGTLGAYGAIAGEWMEGHMRFTLTLKHVS